MDRARPRKPFQERGTTVEKRAYALGYNDALEVAKKAGFKLALPRPDDTITTSGIIPLSRATVASFLEGLETAHRDLDKPCEVAAVTGDKKHDCGLPGCVAKLSAEKRARMEKLGVEREKKAKEYEMLIDGLCALFDEETWKEKPPRRFNK